jgi:hypothetical protein
MEKMAMRTYCVLRQVRTLGIHFVGEPQTFLAKNSYAGTTNHLLPQFVSRSETSEEAAEEHEFIIFSWK